MRHPRGERIRKVLAWMAENDRSTIDTREIVELLGIRGGGDQGPARVFAASMVKRGAFVRVMPGTYALATSKVQPASLLARLDARFGGGHALSHASAMVLHGYRALTAPAVPILALERSQSRGTSFGVRLRVVKSVARGLGNTVVLPHPRHGPLRVTSLERTALDALERPELSGGHLHAVGFLAHALAAHGPEHLVAEAQSIGARRTCARLGFLLQLAGVEPRQLAPLRARVPSRYVNLFPGTLRAGEQVPDWQVRINVPIAPVQRALSG